MTTVSKGSLRINKQKVERLSRAVPTLDLRRKQLNRELLVWEGELQEVETRFNELSKEMDKNPHPDIDAIVEIDRVEMKVVNIAGVLLEDVERVEFKQINFSIFTTPPSFDVLLNLKKDVLETGARLDAKRKALAVLIEELEITTQRINLFEKRLIPEFRDEIRYIKGRLEDNERASVMIAKIAQAEMLSEQYTFETA